jgi:hypothetical protein
VISPLPSFHETIVLPRSADAVQDLLMRATSNKLFRQSDEDQLFFNGWVQKYRFRFSLRRLRANHYLPLVIGKVEATSSGSILFVDYKLIPTTRVLLVLWTLLLTLGAFIVSYQLKNNYYLLGGTGAILLIHAIVHSNFRLQLKPTRSTLHHLLS